MERFHLVEYGLLTFLFHRVWRHAGDVASLVLPAAAVLLTALADEWVQWFVPDRVGELRDVLLNGAAVACGLLFSIGVDARPPLRARLAPDRRARLALALAALVIASTGFVQTVHLGFEIVDSEIGTFRSRWTRAALEEARDERERRWQGAPPLDAPRVSQEDQYLGEALWHIRRRNEATAANDWARAVMENRILERFFTPVLDGPGTRWPREQQADIEARAAALPPAGVSDANAIPIYLIDWRALWLGALTIAGVLVWALLKRPRVFASTSSIAVSII